MHYMRWKTHGDPGGPEQRMYGASLEELFWAKVDRRGADDCWLWAASTHAKGYGKGTFKGKGVSAHRFSYELHKGPIPEGLTIDHLCGNKACVNPDHLEAVTNAENIRRRSQQQTHCKRGHELSGDNVKIYNRASGYASRTCVTCQREQARIYYAKKKRKRA